MKLKCRGVMYVFSLYNINKFTNSEYASRDRETLLTNPTLEAALLISLEFRSYG